MHATFKWYCVRIHAFVKKKKVLTYKLQGKHWVWVASWWGSPMYLNVTYNGFIISFPYLL